MIKKLPITYIGHVVCSNVRSNINVVQEFVRFYKDHIYYKGLTNGAPVELITEITELVILSSTALSETTELEATKLIPRFLNFFNHYSPEYCTFEEIPKDDFFGNTLFVYGFFSISRIELLDVDKLQDLIKETYLSEQERTRGQGIAIDPFLLFAVDACFKSPEYFELVRPLIAKIFAIPEDKR